MQLPFYYDYACPWAYLGSCRVEAYFADLADAGVTVDFRPVQLATLKEPETGSAPAPAPTPNERKRRWYEEDLRGWAELVGAELDTSNRHLIKRSTRLALKAGLVARDAGRFREYHHPAYRARWAEGRDLSDPEVVRALLAGAGLDADEALARAESPELEARLEQDTRDAIERGVFGVPTLLVGDRLFWGNDRFELVRYSLERALARDGSDRAA